MTSITKQEPEYGESGFDEHVAMRLYRVERYGPLTRLLFTVDRSRPEGDLETPRVWQEPVVSVVMPTEAINDMIEKLTAKPPVNRETGAPEHATLN